MDCHYCGDEIPGDGTEDADWGGVCDYCEMYRAELDQEDADERDPWRE